MVFQRQIPAHLGVELRPISQKTSACSVRRFALENRQVAHGLNALTGLNGRLAVQPCCRVGEHVEVDDGLLGLRANHHAVDLAPLSLVAVAQASEGSCVGFHVSLRATPNPQVETL